MKENIKKILISIGVIFLSFIVMLFLGICIQFDNILNAFVHYVSFLLFLIILLSKIWKNTHEKTVKCIILFVIFLANILYYNFLSMRIVPLVYLNAKYDVSYFNMKIIDTYRNEPGGFLSSGSPRGAIVECDGMEVFVYHGRNGWTDDYEEQSEIKNNDTNILTKFHSIIGKYSNKYKIISDPGLAEYGYIIFLQTEDYLTIKNVIYGLDNSIVNYRKEFNIHPKYSIYITKENSVYSKLLSINTRSLKNGGQTYAFELLDALNLRVSRLASFNIDDYSAFSNYGNINDNIIKKYKNLLFYYDASPNGLIGNVSKNIEIFGIE